MASAIGIALISSILPPMAAKAMAKVKGMVVDKVDAIVNIQTDISGLQTTLCMIQGIVQEVEEKQINNVYIQKWLRDLVDIGYEARDVLEDFITFSSCTITTEETSKPVNFIPSLMLNCFCGSSSDTSNIPLSRLNKLSKDIKCVRERFDEKKNEGETFKTIISAFVEGGFKSVCLDRRSEGGPSINRDSLFLGRENMKKNIMDKILHPSDDCVHVVVIWGMGGIGKTTLAQSIYKDARVKQDDYPTKNKRWMCVRANNFIAKEIIVKIIHDSSTDDVEILHEKLVEKFRGNRFLIVLDDVLDVDSLEWDLLFNPLTEVGKGGLIIITTRSREVCTAIKTKNTYELLPLSEKDSWSLFESCAFIDGKSETTPDLKRIGKEIVKKLNGLPLALKVVGGSLFDKDSSTWTNFEKSIEWQLRNDDEVMSVLRWSYNHLPRHLKMCFTYCALFPKDHVLDKKVLVEMWMAHDLIQKQVQERLEDVGAQYFEQLVNHSLLQCVDGKYRMHDLIRNLALLVSNEEFATANNSLTDDQMKKVRHVTITPGDYSKIPSLCKIEKLHTLYTISSDGRNTKRRDVLDGVFKQMKSIRVMVLSSYGIHEIPGCISELKHLRYLDVSRTFVESLPDSLCHLYNLQMLAAPHAKLPRDIVKVVNLRYVRANLSTCKGVGKLTSLQELSSIHVSKGDNIRELGDMQRLRGKLRIEGLGNVEKLEDDVGALMEKQTLMDELVLQFDKQLENSTISEEVLDALGCPPNLTYLQISGYTGVKSPNWMVDGKHKFDKLQTLYLYDCPKLESLPSLRELTSLKHLSLWNVGVKRLESRDFHKLSSLETLSINRCPKLQSLPPDFHILSSLKNLFIENCPQLKLSIPYFKKFSSLEKLHIKSRPQDQSLKRSIHSLVIAYKLRREERWKLESTHDWHQIKHISNLYLSVGEDNFITVFGGTLGNYHKGKELQSLKIKDCPEMQSLPLDFHKLSSLESLRLNCQQLQSLPPDFHMLSSLVELSIYDCPELQSLPHDFHMLSSLMELSIYDCPELHSLPPDFHKLSSLATLSINHCPELQSLPADFHMLPSLKNLFIENCPQLQLSIPYFKKLSSLEKLHITSRPQDQSLKSSINSLAIAYQLRLEERCKLEPTHDWHQIKHIRNLYLYAGNLITVSGGTLGQYGDEGGGGGGG